jgi:hypothetical protein
MQIWNKRKQLYDLIDEFKNEIKKFNLLFTKYEPDINNPRETTFEMFKRYWYEYENLEKKFNSLKITYYCFNNLILSSWFWKFFYKKSNLYFFNTINSFEERIKSSKKSIEKS